MATCGMSDVFHWQYKGLLIIPRSPIRYKTQANAVHIHLYVKV